MRRVLIIDDDEPSRKILIDTLSEGGYMGLHHLAEIMSGLLQSGCDPQKPVALIESGTLEAQRTLQGTVAQIDALAQHWKFRPPTVIVVGEVVRLGQELQWLRSRKCRPIKSDVLVDIT